MKVAITGLNNVDNPGPGVPVIRGIRDSEKFKGEIIGLIYDSIEPGPYLPGVADRSYIIPYPSGGIDILFERLKSINNEEHIDVIIPTLDAELFAFSKLAPRLEEIGIKTFLPSIEQLKIRGKDKLYDFCVANGIKAPKNILLTSIQDVYKIKSEMDFPVVIKGIFYDAHIVNNTDEALNYFNKLSSKWGLPIIAQEFVKGDEYNVVALGDGTGKTIGAVGMKKLYITEKGKGWAGISINDEKLMEISNQLIQALKWKSGAELEFIKDEKSKDFYLLEINPRFPAWVYLAVGAGQNLPFAQLELALGKEVKQFNDYEVGKIFIRYSWDYITDIKRLEEITVKGRLNNE